MELELYTIGYAITPLTAFEKLMINISWTYWLGYNLIIWGLIGIIYLIDYLKK
jgi:hypothetical protein